MLINTALEIARWPTLNVGHRRPLPQLARSRFVLADMRL